MRTLPERSEVRGNSRDTEGLRTGSLHRVRLGSERSSPCVAVSHHRKLSTASTPSSYKVGTAEEDEEELDPFGYVLPGSPGTPERVSRMTHSSKRNSKRKNNLLLTAVKPPQEYELMSPESGVPPCSACSISSHGNEAAGTLCQKVVPLTSSPVMELPLDEAQLLSAKSNQIEEACEGAAAKQRDLVDKDQPNCKGEIKPVDHKTEVGRGICRYEYMDIRHSDSSEGGESELESSGNQPSSTSGAETDQTVGGLVKEKREDEETAICHTNKQPAVQEDLSSRVVLGADVLAAGDGKDEYEEMSGFGEAPSEWGHAEYENLPTKARAVPEERDSDRCVRIGEYIKVCAGIGEPGSNTSFDNPDYWHSRLFLKPDAVRT